MKSMSVFTRFVLLAVAAVMFAGCANQLEPAKKAIADIEAAVAAAGPDAAQYIPDELQAVTTGIADLKAKLDAKDYKGVLAAAPALLASAQGLAGSAANAKQAAEAAKAAALQALNDEWGALAADVPSQLAAVTSRVGILSKSKKLPAGLDASAFDAAKSSADEAKALWDQAASAQSAGNVEQAVTAARQVKEKLDTAMAALGMSAG